MTNEPRRCLCGCGAILTNPRCQYASPACRNKKAREHARLHAREVRARIKHHRGKVTVLQPGMADPYTVGMMEHEVCMKQRAYPGGTRIVYNGVETIL